VAGDTGNVDDTGCGCELDPESDPAGAVVVTGGTPEVRMAVDPRCRLHGAVARVVNRRALRKVGAAAAERA
jgi:hypothetical protein